MTAEYETTPMTTTHTPAPGWALTADPVAQRVTLRGPGPEDYACAGPDAPDLNGRALYALGQAMAGAPQVAAAPAMPTDEEMVAAAYATTGAAQGLPKAVAFNQGARWMRDRLAAAPEVAAPGEPRPYPRMPDFFSVWLAIGTWREADHIEIAEKAALVDKRLEAVLRAYVDADRPAQAACTGGSGDGL